MNCFGDFLYALRKEKGMTQADLAQALGVTNKAVSKWETGEAMPETGLLLPLSRIFGVTVDELLAGKRAERLTDDGSVCNEKIFYDELKKHMFTRGKDDRTKSPSEKVCGAICGAVVMLGTFVYVLLGALANLWHPYWIIIPVCALSCGIIGIVFDLCNADKRNRKLARGENPFVGGVCGLITLSSTIAYLFVGVFTGLWHPCWVIVVGAALLCFIVGAVGGALTKPQDK